MHARCTSGMTPYEEMTAAISRLDYEHLCSVRGANDYAQPLIEHREMPFRPVPPYTTSNVVGATRCN